MGSGRVYRDETQTVLTDKPSPHPTLKAIGLAVKLERERLELTQAELAELSGHHYNTISRVETGQSTTVAGLWWICEALHCPMSELLSIAENIRDE
jgi:transcriptional regulator with XRE-family HTH domain